MANAPGSGTETLRDLEGTCDWCGDHCHPNSELCVVTSCNRCEDPGIYHQGCVGKFLKQYGFPSSRKVGFPCPRGRGKGTQCTKECPGRIDRSHPIIPKNEEKKKRALPPPISEVMGNPGAKQPAVKPVTTQNNKAQQVAKPGLPARKLAHPKPHELSVRYASSVHSAAPVPNAWHRAEGVNYAIREAPLEPVESAYTVLGSDQPKPANVPVGLVLEEALTKAQKKNLARRKKKQQAATADGQHSEAGTAVTDGSADLNSLDDWVAAEQQRNRAGTAGNSAPAPENLLAGHTKFVTDPARYLQLLGLLNDDSDTDSDGEGDQDASLSPAATPVLSFSNSPGSSSATSVDAESSAAAYVPAHVPVAVPIAVPVVLPMAEDTMLVASAASATALATPTVLAATPATPASGVIIDDDAALREALELSKKQYELEQEIHKQRMVLAGGVTTSTPVPTAVVASPVVATPEANATPKPLSFTFPQALTISPLAIAPPVRDLAPIMLPKLEAATPAGYGYLPAPPPGLFGSSNPGLQQSKMGLHFNKPTNGYAPMATSHHGSTMAGIQGDDDLIDLLALCGVAG